jgi:hypothetical protein
MARAKDIWVEQDSLGRWSVGIDIDTDDDSWPQLCTKNFETEQEALAVQAMLRFWLA